MKLQLSEILISDSIITQDDFNKAHKKNNSKTKNIGFTLLKLGYLTQRELEKAIIKKNQQIIKDTEMILDYYTSFMTTVDTLRKN